MSQVTSFAISGGGGGGITSITPDTGGPQSGPLINLLANATAGSSVSFSGNSNTIQLNTSDSNNNTIIGARSGNTSISGQSNTILGVFSGNALVSGQSNTIIGCEAGISLLDGTDNIIIGKFSGNSYSGSESFNIIIGGNRGTVGDSNTAIIGFSSDSFGSSLNRFFIDGVVGVTPDVNDGIPVFISSNGQLSTTGTSAGGITSITGTSGGAQSGPSITLAGGTTGLSFGGSANTITTTFAGITANGGTVSLATDSTASTILVGTGAGVKTSTFGSTHTTSTTTVQSGSGGINITNTNNPITITSGTGIIGIATDSTGNIVNIATGTGAKIVTVGSTTTTSGLALKSGTGNFSLASATGTIISALAAGEVTMPLQPAFLAYLTTSVANVTGDGTQYTIIYDTKAYDQSSNFNLSTSTFTAPVAGVYNFSYSTYLNPLTALNSNGVHFLVTTAANYMNCQFNYGAMEAGGTIAIGTNVYANMNIGDTATLVVEVDGSTATVGVVGTDVSGGRSTYFSGVLVV